MASTKARLAQTTSHLVVSAMETTTLKHPSLPSLTGVRSTVEGVSISQFRGIQYGVIEKRFAAAVARRYESDAGSAGLECTSFGYVLYLISGSLIPRTWVLLLLYDMGVYVSRNCWLIYLSSFQPRIYASFHSIHFLLEDTASSETILILQPLYPFLPILHTLLIHPFFFPYPSNHGYARPICPQNYTSPSVLLRVPEKLEDELERQDEFECLNLTITAPAEGKGGKMPVLVWVHGM